MLPCVCNAASYAKQTETKRPAFSAGLFATYRAPKLLLQVKWLAELI
jgi:hypothetical protein